MPVKMLGFVSQTFARKHEEDEETCLIIRSKFL